MCPRSHSWWHQGAVWTHSFDSFLPLKEETALKLRSQSASLQSFPRAGMLHVKLETVCKVMCEPLGGEGIQFSKRSVIPIRLRTSAWAGCQLFHSPLRCRCSLGREHWSEARRSGFQPQLWHQFSKDPWPRQLTLWTTDIRSLLPWP